MDFREYLQNNYSSSRTKSTLNVIERFTAYTQNAETSTFNDILQYISFLRKKGLHPKTVRNNLFAIKQYYKWVQTEGRIKYHPCNNLNLKDNINRKIQDTSFYTLEEMHGFYESVRTRKKHLLQRDKMLVGLLVFQGMTVTEISNLNTNDIDLENGTVNIKASPQNRSRKLPLETRQIMPMHKYITETRPMLLKRKNRPITETALILTENGTRLTAHAISRQINTCREKHEKMLPHKIRQSLIAHLLKSGKNLREVQVFAGHRRAASTENYKQTGLEELKEAIQKCHPLG